MRGTSWMTSHSRGRKWARFWHGRMPGRMINAEWRNGKRSNLGKISVESFMKAPSGNNSLNYWRQADIQLGNWMPGIQITLTNGLIFEWYWYCTDYVNATDQNFWIVTMNQKYFIYRRDLKIRHLNNGHV